MRKFKIACTLNYCVFPTFSKGNRGLGTAGANVFQFMNIYSQSWGRLDINIAPEAECLSPGLDFQMFHSKMNAVLELLNNIHRTA